MTQARRKDGKFGGKQPMVSVFDKEGNVKVFRCYEELKTWMDEQEKLVSMINGVEPNPDTEPATKGYVKCLLRKTRDHTHEQTYSFGWTLLAAGGLSMYVIASWVLAVVTMGKFALGIEHSFAFMAALILWVVALDFIEMGSTKTSYVNEKEPKGIQTYKEPCEYYTVKEAMREFNERHNKKQCE